MKSSHRRVSRALVFGVVATITLGVVFWLGKISATRASGPNKEQPTRAAVPIDPGVPKVEAKLASAPTTQSSANVMLAGSAQVSTTQPVGGPRLASGSITTPPSGSPLADAKAKIDAGKLLDARKLLNNALVSGSLSLDDTKAAKKLLNQVNATVVFSPQRFEGDGVVENFTVPPGGVLAKIAQSHEVTPDLLMRVNRITDPKKLRAGQTIKVINGPFNALVNKGEFTLELWQGEPNAKGSTYIISFPVGLGKDDSTPAGTWAVQHPLKNPAYFSPRGGGVIAADDPNNPLGEYWIGLTGTDGHAVGKTSYGIHGTIDPSSIGKQESMGCIRLKNEDVAQVYEMLVEGKSTVTVKD